MREKKYRAWDKVTETFIYSDKVAGGMWRFFKLLEDRGIRHFETDDYTGLKDKNGVEIYEGDIIILDQEDIGGDTYLGEVVWCDDQTLSNLEWGLWLRGKRQGYHPTDFLGHLEVIGNIYENPEGAR